MFIIFETDTKTILSYGYGSPIEQEGKLYLKNNIICNDLTICGWKYIEDQAIESDEFGRYLYDADHYEEVESLPDPETRLAAIEQYLLEQELGL